MNILEQRELVKAIDTNTKAEMNEGLAVTAAETGDSSDAGNLAAQKARMNKGRTYSLLYPDGFYPDDSNKLHNFDFIHSLQTDVMIIIPKGSYRGFSDLSLEQFYTSSPEVIRYRLDVVEDLVDNDDLYNMFCEALTHIFNISEIRRVMSNDYSVDSALTAVRYLEMYKEIVDTFHDSLAKITYKSEGISGLKSCIEEIYTSEEYQNLSKELIRIDGHFGDIKSVTIGINLDEFLRPSEAGLVSLNNKQFKAGSIMDKFTKVLGMEKDVLISPIYPISKTLVTKEQKNFNLEINVALNKLFARTLKDFEPVIKKYFSINTSLFVSLLDDIRFLTVAVGFIRKMKSKGFPMCKPEVREVADKELKLTGVYNAMLALKSAPSIDTGESAVIGDVVSNDFCYDDKGRFYLITGPNHGGKSIFAYSIGMTQSLFQLGLFVPAQSAVMSPVTDIFTHLPESDENNYGKGRLESECARFGDIIKNLKETDLLIMDESFSSTGVREGAVIATEVLTSIGIIGCGGIFVTHIHDLAQQLDIYNDHPDNKGRIDNLVATMSDKGGGQRSYKVMRVTPDGKSYANDIARKYGLDVESIVRNVQKASAEGSEE